MSKTQKIVNTQMTRVSDGSPQPLTRAACVVVIQGEAVGRRADLDESPVIIGRSPEADLHIPHASVSRRHCELWRDGEVYRIRDLGATNRTLLNGEPITHAVLADGDHVTLGQCILKFVSHSSVEARYHQELYQLATRDPLTELNNRRHFMEAVDRELARAIRHGRPLSLCLLDVDRFKPINDRYGHAAGDEVLRQLAGIVRGFVRGEDVAARIGGEEFALLLPETGIEAARALAERLREAVAQDHFELGGQPHRLTISAGIAGLSPGRRDRSALLQAADAALYRAKDEGRDRVCVQDEPA